MRALPAAGFRGVNVTIPHKEAALALADDASPAARAIGAANTLTFERDGAILADNTDAPALLEALRDQRIDPAGRSGARARRGRGRPGRGLGAGRRGRRTSRSGTAHRRAPPRSRASSARATSRSRARPRSSSTRRAWASTHNIDLFKAIPLKADTFESGSCVIDMVYGSGETRFLATARSRGARVVDGLEILVAQGVASFERWTGKMAPRQAMRGAVTTSPSP